MTSTLNQNVKVVLYFLKKQYGQALSIVRKTRVSTDDETGAVEYNTQTTTIRRAVFAPYQYLVEVFVSLRIANLAGAIPHNKRYVIIDIDDLPVGWEIDAGKDTIVFDSKTWKITSVEKAEHNQAVLLILEAL